MMIVIVQLLFKKEFEEYVELIIEGILAILVIRINDKKFIGKKGTK